MYPARVLQVIITIPNDVPNTYFNNVVESINKWNLFNSETLKIILKPVRWETNVHTYVNNEEPEQIINTDLMIGIFWTRIGTPSKRYICGSVEEIERHVQAGRPAILYFLKKRISSEMQNNESDMEQYKQLCSVKEEWGRRGLPIREINTKTNPFFDDLSQLMADNRNWIQKLLRIDDLDVDSLIYENCQFRYHFLPSPDGERVWYRKSMFRWIEKSPHSPIPDKVYLCYSESDSVVSGVRGIVVQCVSRDEDIGFQVFIPEKNKKDMWLYCRRVNKRGSDWVRLGVSPIDYF